LGILISSGVRQHRPAKGIILHMKLCFVTLLYYAFLAGKPLVSRELTIHLFLTAVSIHGVTDTMYTAEQIYRYSLCMSTCYLNLVLYPTQTPVLNSGPNSLSAG